MSVQTEQETRRDYGLLLTFQASPAHSGCLLTEAKGVDLEDSLIGASCGARATTACATASSTSCTATAAPSARGRAGGRPPTIPAWCS